MNEQEYEEWLEEQYRLDEKINRWLGIASTLFLLGLIGAVGYIYFM